jgi:hypothetical protein
MKKNQLLSCPVCGKKPSFKWANKLDKKIGFHTCKSGIYIIVSAIVEDKTVAAKWNEWAKNDVT